MFVYTRVVARARYKIMSNAVLNTTPDGYYALIGRLNAGDTLLRTQIHVKAIANISDLSNEAYLNEINTVGWAMGVQMTLNNGAALPPSWGPLDIVTEPTWIIHRGFDWKEEHFWTVGSTFYSSQYITDMPEVQISHGQRAVPVGMDGWVYVQLQNSHDHGLGDYGYEWHYQSMLVVARAA